MSPFVSLYLAPVVSQPGRLSRLSGVEGFICLPLSPFSCLPAWMPGTALWVDGFICLPLSPFIWLPLSPSLDVWVDGFICLPLSPFICLARLSGLCFPSNCLPLSPSLDVWHGSPGGQIHLSPFVSLHLSPVVSQPGCLARLFGWTVSLVSLCLPSFGSPCLPAWMSVTALQADGFTCLPWSPFIYLVGGRIDLSPFVSLYLSPVVSQPGHLSPFVSLCLSPAVSQPGCSSGWTDSFVSRCLPAWMCGTHAPRFPSLPAVLSFWRGLVCLRLRPWLRSFLVLWMLGTGSSVCPSSGLRFCLGSWWVVFLVYRWLHPVCSFSASLSVAASLCPCSHLESRADESGALRCTASATRRLC